MRKLTNTAGAASIKAAAFPPTLRKASVALGSNKARIKIPAVSAFDKSAVTQIPLLGTSNFTFAFVVIISEKMRVHMGDRCPTRVSWIADPMALILGINWKR
ncbi:hypothetical protein KaCgl_19760 [Corynebacterium glutamicum]|nr:hypothetical protein KaCgl_19760 [Corynebacterium glutamicum]